MYSCIKVGKRVKDIGVDFLRVSLIGDGVGVREVEKFSYLFVKGFNLDKLFIRCLVGDLLFIFIYVFLCGYC